MDREFEKHECSFFEAKKRINKLNFGSFALLVSACGSSKSNEVTQQLSFDSNINFPAEYTPPVPNFMAVSGLDENFEVLKPTYVEPYWVNSLEMDKGKEVIDTLLADQERIIYFNFPTEVPNYDLDVIFGWQTASEKIIIASREIFLELERTLDVSFVEDDPDGALNVVSVSQSEQSGTAGYSYFPSLFHEVGMDVFISKGYDEPLYTSAFLTNADYELLIHEIGHALGLKHPFDEQGNNTSILNTYEDQTRYTAMSYDDKPTTFDGSFRSFDWMALTKLYGVNKAHNAGDNSYSFSPLRGVFIIDGDGLDEINASNTFQNVYIDLRPGSHSYQSSKSDYITSGSQLTISHGSDIENVTTGSGNDTVIGTNIANFISTHDGDDIVFAGGGMDVIRSGSGADLIDLSEEAHLVDIVTLDVSVSKLEFDTIYGFVQGALGDVLDISQWGAVGTKLFPLVVAGAAPSANFGGGILRVVGDGLSTLEGLSLALAGGGELSPLTLSSGSYSIIITSASQGTGEDQCVYSAEGLAGGGIEVSQLALLQGNALDIDQWHADNFSVIA